MVQKFKKNFDCYKINRLAIFYMVTPRSYDELKTCNIDSLMSNLKTNRKQKAFRRVTLSSILTVLTFFASFAFIAITVQARTLIKHSENWSRNPLDQYSVACRERVLRELGWSIEEVPNLSQPEYFHDPQCYDTVQPHGWRPHNILKLPSNYWQQIQTDQLARLPAHHPPVVTVNDILNWALQDDGSRCTFQQKYNRAIHATVNYLRHRLDLNNGWKAPLHHDWQFWWPFFTKRDIALGLRHVIPYWHVVQCVTPGGDEGTNICYEPDHAHLSRAFHSLAHNFVFADCREGMQVAQYLALARVFGSSLSQAFARDPVQMKNGKALDNGFYLGPDAESSHSVLFSGSVNGTLVTSQDGQISLTMDPTGVSRARIGSEAFVGTMGEIDSVRPNLIDDPNNATENFIVYSTDSDALHSLIRHGGVPGFDRSLKQIWHDAEVLRAEIGIKNGNGDKVLQYLENYERAGDVLPTRTIPPFILALTPDNKIPLVARTYWQLARWLNDPFFRDTLIFVQPVGLKSIAYHIMRLAIINPRTPFKIRLNFDPDTLQGAVFDHWLKTKLDQCGHTNQQ